jgi:crotonobetainyl-CoA:carnitine CoA-transferase CaiB-like acyl-CoA transferase
LRQLAGKGRSPGMNGKFLNFNRGKKSIALDLKAPSGLAALHRLAATVDVFVSNIRPDAQARLGVDAASLHAIAPRLIHCAITGFGSGGPYAGRPAYDTVIQGAAGVAGCFEASTGEPRYVPMLVADHTVGLIAAQMIGFALYRREKTGVGEAIEVPMFENMAAFVLQQHMGALTYDPPIGEPGDARILSPDSRPIPTADGYVCVSANTDAQAHGFFDAIGRPELKSDPRFSTLSARVAHTADYFAVRMSALKDKPSAHWLAVFDAHDVPAMPYNTIESLLTDPHVQAVGLLARETHPSEGETFAIRSPNKMSGGMAPLGRPASRLGEDGRQALRDFGFDAEEIECLIRAGALVTPTK